MTNTFQIQLLLSYLIDDPRQSVKRQALFDANMLARQSPHIWESNHVKVNIIVIQYMLVTCCCFNNTFEASRQTFVKVI